MVIRKGFFGSLVGLAAGAGLALAEAPTVAPPPATAGPFAPPTVSAPADCLAPACPLDDCPAAPRVWANAEYLLWWVKDQPLAPALLTTGPAAAGPFVAGALGVPGTVAIQPNLDYG